MAQALLLGQHGGFCRFGFRLSFAQSALAIGILFGLFSDLLFPRRQLGNLFLHRSLLAGQLIGLGLDARGFLNKFRLLRLQFGACRGHRRQLILDRLALGGELSGLLGEARLSLRQVFLCLFKFDRLCNEFFFPRGQHLLARLKLGKRFFMRLGGLSLTSDLLGYLLFSFGDCCRGLAGGQLGFGKCDTGHTKRLLFRNMLFFKQRKIRFHFSQRLLARLDILHF